MIKPIITNIKELRKPCLEVTKEDDIKSIVQDLKDTLESKKCVGLTANQIGFNKKISYIKIPKTIDKNKQVQYGEYVLINAKIIEKERLIKVKGESCMSFPGIDVITRRYVFCIVQYYNEKMELQTGTFQDLESICVQHECDHQTGITIFQRKWVAK